MKKTILLILLGLICQFSFGQSPPIQCEVANPKDIDLKFPISPKINPPDGADRQGSWSVNTPYGGCPNTCNTNSPFDCCIDMPCEPYQIPVVFTLLADNSCGNMNLTVGELDAFLDKINNYYACLGVPFELFKCPNWETNGQNQLSDGSTRQICNNDLNLFYLDPIDDQAPNDPAGDMNSDFSEAVNFNIPNVMNIYIPGNYNGFTNQGYTSEGGVALYPTSSLNSYGTAFGIDGIKNTSTNCNTASFGKTTVAIHEFGHWFGLVHTHGSVNNVQVNAGAGNSHVECPDGSNCCNRGDYICDTDPDPNLSGGSVEDTGGNIITSCVTSSGCNYDLSNCHSICSTPYPSSFVNDNVMSYGNCGYSLTQCQIAKMVDALLCARDNLSCCDPDFVATDDASPYVSSPSISLCAGSTLPTFTIDKLVGDGVGSANPPLNTNCIKWYATADNDNDWTPIGTGVNFTPPTTGPNATNPNIAGTYTYYFDDSENNYNLPLCDDYMRKYVELTINACCPVADDVTLSSTITDTLLCVGENIDFLTTANSPSGYVEGVDYVVEWTGLSGNLTGGTGAIPADYTATSSITGTAPPTINLQGPSTIVWSCGSPFDDTTWGVSAFDDVDGDITNAVMYDYSNLCVEQSGTYQLTYTVEDSEGNVTIANRTVIIPAGCSGTCTTLPSFGGNCVKKQTYIVNGNCLVGGTFYTDTIDLYISQSTISATAIGANTNAVEVYPNCSNWLITWDDGQGNTGTGATYDSDDYNTADGTVTFTLTNPYADPSDACYQEIIPVPFTGNGVLNPPVSLKLKAFLEGSYQSGTSMETNLVTGANTNFPLNQPFNSMPWNHAGTESIAALSSLPPTVVDWILVELYDNSDNFLAAQAGFLVNDGSILDVNLNDSFTFPSQSAGNFKVVLRHRNHLDIMSSSSIYLPSTIGNVIDFTDPANVMSGNSQLVLLASSLSLYGLHAGDVSTNGIINIADYNQYLNEAAGTTISIYQQGDCDLDGNITSSDFNTYKPNASVIGIPMIRY